MTNQSSISCNSNTLVIELRSRALMRRFEWPGAMGRRGRKSDSDLE